MTVSPNSQDDQKLQAMQIWVDADACPKVARELICKTAIRTKTTAHFIANQPIPLAKSVFVKMTVVGKGFDVADNFIVEHCQANDLVITNDIPMANDVIDKLGKSAKIINFTGKRYTKDNIKQALNMRDFMETMRGTGVLDPSEMGGQKPYSDKDKKAFADGLNRLVSVQS